MKHLKIYSFALLLSSVMPVFMACSDDDDSTESPSSFCPDANHPHAIDLGLKSGVKWSCCNVGATSPEQYGNYYAWGETQPKDAYDWQTYQYGKSRGSVTNIGKDISGTQYDAATASWGSSWKMPVDTLISELIDSVTTGWINKEWKTVNGVRGLKFTSKNGAKIFLPAAAHRYGNEQGFVGTNGNYWSSTVDPIYAQDAACMHFSAATNKCVEGTGSRTYGYVIRPISK